MRRSVPSLHWLSISLALVLILSVSACSPAERASVDKIADELIAEEGTVFPPTPEPPPTEVPTPVPEPTKKVSFNLQDPTNDTRVCSSGLPLGSDADPRVDFINFSFENDPQARVTTFSMAVAAPELSGSIAGGIEFFYPEDELPTFDPNWFFNNVGQNSINFVISGDEVITSRAFVDQGNWTFADETGATGSMNGGQIDVTIPHAEFMPADLGLASTTFYFFPTITNYSECDELGVNPPADPASIQNFDPDELGSIFADGFESGDVSAWSY